MTSQIKTLKKAIEVYGEISQIVKAIEELSELQQALAKHLNGYTDIDNIAEEMADCRIMLDQLDYIFSVEEESWECYDKKIERLSRRLNETKTETEKDETELSINELNELFKELFGLDILAEIKTNDEHSISKLFDLYKGTEIEKHLKNFKK